MTATAAATRVTKILAALDEFDAARADLKRAQDRLRNAEHGIKGVCGLDTRVYHDHNETVAAIARQLSRELRKAPANQEER